MAGHDVVESDVLERVLGTAMRTGGEFAEVFIEDKRSTMAGLDDGRIEQVTSGRDRGAGIRVVKGDTTGFAHTADLSEAGLRAAAEAAAAAASQGTGGENVVALDPSARASRSARSSGSPTRCPRPTRSRCCNASTRLRVPVAAPSCRSARATATAASGS